MEFELFLELLGKRCSLPSGIAKMEYKPEAAYDHSHFSLERAQWRMKKTESKRWKQFPLQFTFNFGHRHS
jgi:hypothetical protein